MRTTIAGALMFFGSFAFFLILGRATGSIGGPVGAMIFLALIVAGFTCLIVGPILWVRGARRSKAEEMDLLRQIAAQGKSPTA